MIKRIRFNFRSETLFLVLGFAMGILVFPLIQLIRTDFINLLGQLVPEALGITFTALLVDSLYRNHEDRQLKRQLLEQLGSRINSVSLAAAEGLWATCSLRPATVWI